MEQLVGQRCELCRLPIGWAGDSRFCAECDAPVHNECARVAVAQPPDPDLCEECGAVVRRRRGTLRPDRAAVAQSWARDRRLLIILMAVFLLLFVMFMVVVFAFIMWEERANNPKRAAAVMDRPKKSLSQSEL